MIAGGAAHNIARKETLNESKIISQSSVSPLNNKMMACCVANDKSFMIYLSHDKGNHP